VFTAFPKVVLLYQKLDAELNLCAEFAPNELNFCLSFAAHTVNLGPQVRRICHKTATSY